MTDYKKISTVLAVIVICLCGMDAPAAESQSSAEVRKLQALETIARELQETNKLLRAREQADAKLVRALESTTRALKSR